MFGRCERLLKEYAEALKRTGVAHESEYVIEVQQRLKQQILTKTGYRLSYVRVHAPLAPTLE